MPKPVDAKEYVPDVSEGNAKWDPRVALHGSPIISALEKEGHLWKRDVNGDFLNGGPSGLLTKVKSVRRGQKYIMMGEDENDTFMIGPNDKHGQTIDGFKVRGISNIASEHYLKNPTQRHEGRRGYMVVTNLDYVMNELKGLAKS